VCEFLLTGVASGREMTATPSIDLPRWMAERLSEAGPDLLRNMMQAFAEALMSADAEAVCAASATPTQPRPQERPQQLSEPGLGHLGGKHRPGCAEASRGFVFPGLAVGAASAGRIGAVSTVASQLSVRGQHPTDGETVEEVGIARLSKSQLWEMAKDLDGHVEAFCTRRPTRRPGHNRGLCWTPKRQTVPHALVVLACRRPWKSAHRRSRNCPLVAMKAARWWP
jgi:hypothetical protein